MKVCTFCKEPKSTSEFHTHSLSKDGFQTGCKVCNLLRAQAKREMDRITAIEKLGGCCVHCGFSDSRALQFDHVNGGGRQESIAGRGYAWISRQIIKGNTDGFQLLCANCNWIKRHENQERGGIQIKM